MNTNVRLEWLMQLPEMDPMALLHRIVCSTDHYQYRLDSNHSRQMQMNLVNGNFLVDSRKMRPEEQSHYRVNLYVSAHLIAAQHSIVSRMDHHENCPNYLFADRN